MDKLKMQTVNKVDENYKKLAEMFSNAVTETIDENGEVVLAIDKDVQVQEIFFVMRDSSMANDSVATNFEQIFATYSPDTVRKVL